jgi:hypothetical protein
LDYVVTVYGSSGTGAEAKIKKKERALLYQYPVLVVLKAFTSLIRMSSFPLFTAKRAHSHEKILWWPETEILFDLHRSSPFIGEQR